MARRFCSPVRAIPSEQSAAGKTRGAACSVSWCLTVLKVVGFFRGRERRDGLSLKELYAKFSLIICEGYKRLSLIFTEILRCRGEWR